MMRQRQTILLLLLSAAMVAGATVRLPRLFQSGMVLQRGKPIPVWGKADAGERVTVTFRKKNYETTADANGDWRIDLPVQKAGGPYTMTVGQITLDDILIGDVWLCSGQSNMDVHLERVYPQYQREIDAYANERIRLFRVQTDKDTHGPGQDVLPASWKTLNKKDAWHFSAIGCFLAKRMYERYGVPQGVICNSLGGTPVEAWIAADSLKTDFPMFYEKTRLYQDDEMVAAYARAGQRAADRWFQLLNETDPGVREGWASLSYQDQDWRVVNQYDKFWERGRTFSGSMWLRQHVRIDAAHAGKPARLLVGTLYDQDYTYLNGQEVGHTAYQYPPRRYAVPEGALREGDNVLTVRFVNKTGIPHFIKEKPYMLIFGDGDTIRLHEEWRLRVGTEMPACPGGGEIIQNLPSVLYNAMLYPLHPYAVSGVVWYQGESNTGENAGSSSNNGPSVYGQLLRKMIGNWRQLWNDPQLPFVVVQLANFMEPSEQPQNSNWARLREAQRQVVRDDPYAELAVAIDLGEAVDIHPLRKKEVAQRVALGFDKLVYGQKVTLTPEILSAVREGDRVVVTFDQPLRPVAVRETELAGSDGRYVNVRATAQGRQLVIDIPGDMRPAAVRYAWKDNPVHANLYGATGLPVSPFEYPLGE